MIWQGHTPDMHSPNEPIICLLMLSPSDEAMDVHHYKTDEAKDKDGVLNL